MQRVRHATAFARADRGAALLEYAVLAAAIAGVLVWSVSSLQDAFAVVADQLRLATRIASSS